jgi:pyrrolidone-carboxylate peptidase
MRILVYGFGPYRQYKRNITAEILRTIPLRKGLRKIIFPVRFYRGQFVDAIDRCRPDIILGLGQSSGIGIRLEARARNQRRGSKRVPLRSIRRDGPRWLATTLKLKAGRQARRSNNAGDYVCNYSMYVALEHIRRKRLQTRFGFVHIPHDFNRREARRYVLDLLKAVSREPSAVLLKI